MHIKMKNIPLLLLLSISLSTVHAQDNITEKELKYSIKKGIPSIKKLLKKVSIYKLYPEDKTLLHYAVEAGNYKVVSYLVRHNILLDQKGGILYGTALHEAILYGYPRIANFLIEHDMPLNEQDIEGNTALHLAADSGDLSIVENLLAHGASKEISNNQGETPFNLVQDLSVDDSDRLKDMLLTTNNESSLNYNDLDFTDGVISIQKGNNIIFKKIDTKSTFNNSNLGINIHSNSRKD